MAADPSLNSDTPSGGEGYEYKFLASLEQIAKSTAALAEIMPKKFAALSKQLGDEFDVYKNAGPSRGKPGVGQTTSISASSSLAKSTPATARAQLNADARGDSTETEVQGGTPAQTMGGATWQARVRRGNMGQILPMPRFPGAEPNANDLLNYASTVAANFADKRQTSLDASTPLGKMVANGDITVDDRGAPENPTAKQQAILSDAGAPQATRLGKVSDAFSSMESAYANTKYIKGILGKVSGVVKPFDQARGYAYETGYQGSGAGFMGLRSPFDGGAMTGIGQKLSQFSFSMGNNVSPAQAKLIYDNLYQRGWYGGGSTDAMRTSAAQLISKNPMIGSQAQTFDMMDKATRFGAESLTQFNTAMLQIPNAAKAANTSIADTQAAMQDLGTANTQVGGTFAGGMQNALTWQQTTGMSAQIMGQLMQNPMVVGQTYAASGLMPQMQGLATPAQHMQGIFKSLDIYNRGIVTPANKQAYDPITGLSTTITGASQKDALIASQMGIPEDQVKSLLKNKRGIMAGVGMENAGQTYENSITTALQNHKAEKALGQLTGAPWSRIQSAMNEAVDSGGHKIFEGWGNYRALKAGGMSDKDAHKAAQLYARRAVTNAGDTKILGDASNQNLSQALRKLHLNDPDETNQRRMTGLNKSQRASVAQQILKDAQDPRGSKVSGQMIKDVAHARSAEMQKFVTQNTKKFGTSTSNNDGPQLTIELGPAAKKAFHLSDPKNQQKANQGAGSVAVALNAYVGGATAAPAPDFTTAGNSGAPGGSGGY